MTNKRIIIVSEIFDQEVTTHDIKSLPALSIEDKIDGTGTIYLNSPSGKTYRSFMTAGMMDKSYQLEQIDNAREVFDMIEKNRGD